MIVLICYDLHKPDRDYAAVIERIKSFGSWAHVEESVWLVDTAIDPETCCNRLRGVTDDATFFAFRLRLNWAGIGLDGDVAQWLKSPSRRW